MNFTLSWKRLSVVAKWWEIHAQDQSFNPGEKEKIFSLEVVIHLSITAESRSGRTTL